MREDRKPRIVLYGVGQYGSHVARMALAEMLGKARRQGAGVIAVGDRRLQEIVGQPAQLIRRVD